MRKKAAPQTLEIAVKPRATGRMVVGKARPMRVDKSDRNIAPTQWGRRLARLVGEKYGVAMAENYSKNEGRLRGRDLVIKCAKSQTPPISVLTEMLDRLDDVWAVFLTPDGGGEIWTISAAAMRAHGYQTHGANVPRRVELGRKKIAAIGKLIGTLEVEEVDSCHIP
jgi:hypothetical protein